jgi:hypothetical protein
VKLNPGDSVSVKSCFIDTKADNNQAVYIEEDLAITLKFGYYWTYYDNGLTPIMGGNATGKYYVCAKGDGANNPTGYFLYSQVTYRRIGSTEEYAGFTLTYDYTDINGNPAKGSVYLPHHRQGGNDFSSVPVNFTGKDVSVTTKVSYMNLRGTKGVSASDFTSVPLTATTDYIFPFEGTVTRTLPKGKYQPTQLAQQLSTIFTGIATNANISPTNPSDNPLLNTTKNINTEITAGGTDTFWFFASDASSVLKYDTGANINVYLGTNQLAFEYDTALNKFKIDQQHKPIYDPTSGQPIIKGGTFGTDTYLNNQASGIYMIDVQPQEFFVETLGFDLNNELITPLEQKTHTDGGITYHFLAPALIEGKTITGNFTGLDALILKTGTGTPPITTSDIVPDIGTLRTVSVSNRPIIATTQFASQATTGYFLVDVDNIGADNIGENTDGGKIKAIVSRYYSVNSYTSGGAETDVPFVNVSPYPIYINNLHIRILNPDGTPATDDIEDDNSIFFLVNRQRLLDVSDPPKSITDRNNDKNDKK